MNKKIAYLMSRFPKISETFILYEILELMKLGLHIDIFPLIKQHESAIHSEAANLISRAHYCHIFSKTTLSAQIYWLCKRPRAYLRSWWRAISGNISSLKFLTRAFVVVPKAARFARQIVELEITHVHAHWATHPTLAAYIINQLTDIPYSFTAHAHDLFVDRQMLKEKIHRASFVVTISEYNRELIHELYGHQSFEKTKVIHCGIDPKLLTVSTTKKSNGIFTIICVGRLVEMKGQTYLIEACKRLKDAGISFRCILVGDGDNRHVIQHKISRLGLQGTISLLGNQPRHRVIDLIGSSDVFTLPSVTTHDGNKEGIPVSLMEAMAMKIPVIATSYSGIPELIENEVTGLLIPERNTTALVKALMKYFRSPGLAAKFAVNAQTKVLREFNLARNTQLLLRLLNQGWSNTSSNIGQFTALKEISSGN